MFADFLNHTTSNVASIVSIYRMYTLFTTIYRVAMDTQIHYNIKRLTNFHRVSVHSHWKKKNFLRFQFLRRLTLNMKNPTSYSRWYAA